MAISNIVATGVSASGDVVQPAQGVCTYYGFSLRETSGSATATCRVRETGASGKILDTIQLVAAESAREYYAPQGIRCDGDLYFELVSGAVEGSIRHG